MIIYCAIIARFRKGRNKTKHQFKDTECGIFSMLFIALCLENPKLTYLQVLKLVKTDRNDNGVFNLRDYFYSPPPKHTLASL